MSYIKEHKAHFLGTEDYFSKVPVEFLANNKNVSLKY